MFIKIRCKRVGLEQNKLDDGLEKKIEEFNSCKHKVLIKSFFDWEDFKKVFINKHCQFTFIYKSEMFTIFACDDYAEFWIDGEEKTSYKKFPSGEVLLNNLLIEGNSLENIWDDLIIAS